MVTHYIKEIFKWLLLQYMVLKIYKFTRKILLISFFLFKCLRILYSLFLSYCFLPPTLSKYSPYPCALRQLHIFYFSLKTKPLKIMEFSLCWSSSLDHGACWFLSWSSLCPFSLVKPLMTALKLTFHAYKICLRHIMRESFLYLSCFLVYGKASISWWGERGRDRSLISW